MPEAASPIEAEPGTGSLSAQAYQRLETMIVTAELAPGTVVSEAILSTRTGFGRMPVREAVKRLGDIGLVMILPQRGIVVSPVDTGQYLLMLETRRVLDRLMATAAARRASPAERQEFRALAIAIEAAAAQADLAGFLDIDEAFDRLVEQASRNPFAARANAPFHAHARRFWVVHRVAYDLSRSAEAHATAMRAIADGDEATTERAMNTLADYLEDFARRVIHPG